MKFLDERKDFWQMQKPVYARKAELMPTEKKVSTHNGISKGVVATISAKNAVNLPKEEKIK